MAGTVHFAVSAELNTVSRIWVSSWVGRLTELADNEVFEKTDMSYRPLQLCERQALLSVMMSPTRGRS